MAIAAAVAVVSAAVPAVAQSPTPRRTGRVLVLSVDGLRKSTFAPGEVMVVLGDGFPPDEAGTVFVQQDANQPLGSFSAEDDGRFRIDAELSGVGFGPATVIAGTPSTFGSITITVARPSEGSRTIPSRDRDVTILGALGMGLVGAGVAMLFGARRRKVR